MFVTYPRRAARAISKRAFHPAIGLALVALFGLACLASDGGGDGEAAGDPPSANFSPDRTGGIPGTAILFTISSNPDDITSYSWDFGDGSTSTEEAVVAHTYPDAGTYSVSLTVEGPRGSSTSIQPGLIEIGDPPVVSFSCLPLQGFAPHTVNCTDSSTGASSLVWDFGDGSTSTDAFVSHTYDTVGSYTIELTASGAGEVDQLSAAVEVYPFGISITPATGAAPLDVILTGITGGLTGLIIWTAEGEIIGTNPAIAYRFRNPGTFSVDFLFGNLTLGIAGTETIEVVVDYGPAVAAFSPDVAGGDGPLEVLLMDESVGEISQWEWNFGDGSQCITPAPATPDPDDPIPICNSSSPTHIYQNVGEYDVTLQITGPAADPDDADIVSSITNLKAVRVHIEDPSFEGQIANAIVGDPWTHLRPDDELEAAEHITRSQAAQPDAGMPTEGNQWAVLDGAGTAGIDDPMDLLTIENGIRQSFLKPLTQPVLEFDYVLLYAEPPLSPVLDAMTATVSDGTTTVEIASAKADVSSPYAGPSAIFPTRDESTVRATPVLTASLNLVDAFPTATDQTLFTLTIRTSNAINELRSPLVYVDNIRFTEAASGVLSAQFALETSLTLETLTVATGQEAVFADESCLDPGDGSCEVPTSWRWDFDTQSLLTPPDASGSGEQNPSYVFLEARENPYMVTMTARLADLEEQITRAVMVIEGPVADFDVTVDIVDASGTTFTFTDTSTPSDEMFIYDWDFGGFGDSILQDPTVKITNTGDFVITLTVTTRASGLTDTVEQTVTVVTPP